MSQKVVILQFWIQILNVSELENTVSGIQNEFKSGNRVPFGPPLPCGCNLVYQNRENCLKLHFADEIGPGRPKLWSNKGETGVPPANSKWESEGLNGAYSFVRVRISW